MELGSKSLLQWINERNADENAVIDREQIYNWFMAICSGVKYLHGAENSGIQHGNLKPSNVFICHQGSIKLSDVGNTATDESVVSMDCTNRQLYLPKDLQQDWGKTHVDVYSLGWSSISISISIIIIDYLYNYI